MFTIDTTGELKKVRVAELRRGAMVAIAGAIPDADLGSPVLDVAASISEARRDRFTCSGPSVESAWTDDPDGLRSALRDRGIDHWGYYRARKLLPLDVAFVMGIAGSLSYIDVIAPVGSRNRLRAKTEIDDELAWLLGFYLAEGHVRTQQVTFSNLDQEVLDRVCSVLTGLGLPAYRASGAVTCCSSLLAQVIEGIGLGGKAGLKRVPAAVYGWPEELVASFLEGFIDGDGSRRPERTVLWTSSTQLVGDLMLLASRLGRRSTSFLHRPAHGARAAGWCVTMPNGEHKLLTSVPSCSDLLTRIRSDAGISQKQAAAAASCSSSQLNNIERQGRPLTRKTLRRLLDAYRGSSSASLPKLERLVDGDLLWDQVEDVWDDGWEPVFDIEVRPQGRHIQNFLAGYGGVFVSNTAGFVDAGFEGHLTLELSNVASLPITIYPGMKIGQISFYKMTSPADNPYGSTATGSKYQGQRGPTASRYYKNFED